MSGILDTLGSALMGSGGGILSSLFGGGGSNTGGGMSGNMGGGMTSSGSAGGGFGGILKSLAPIAGTALGTYFGGPMGGMIGGNLAGSLGDSLFGGGSSQQPQQQQQGYGPQQSYGNQFGTSMGNNLNQSFNQYMPQQMQGQTFGNMGGALGSYFGNKFGMPEIGSALGDMANPYIQKYMPESMRNVQMGNFGGYLGGQMGQRMDNGFQSRGMNPYSTANYGSSMQNQLPDYSQSSYGNIPEAPPMGDSYNRAPGGYYGSNNNSNSYSIQQPSNDRSALFNDIRDFRRSPSPQSQSQSGYGNIPEAPPLGNSFNNAPSGSNGYGIRSGFSNRPANIFSEFRDRAAQPGMGLRPTQTRQSGAYPSSGSDSMMDLLRNRMGDIRRDVAPNEFPRSYTVNGGQ